ncbi:hypothetical protein AAMO2058_000021700 [Amorphochlora amoebiformis]
MGLMARTRMLFNTAIRRLSKLQRPQVSRTFATVSTLSVVAAAGVLIRNDLESVTCQDNKSLDDNKPDTCQDLKPFEPSQIEEGAQVWTSHDMCALRRAYSAKISPDGKYVAYSIATPDVMGGGSNKGALYICKFDQKLNQSKLPPIPHVTGRNGKPFLASWDKQSKGVYFLCRRQGDKGHCLYFIPVEGGEAYKLASSPSGKSISSYSVSPDGTWAAVTSPSAKKNASKSKSKVGSHTHEVYETDGSPLPSQSLYIVKLSTPLQHLPQDGNGEWVKVKLPTTAKLYPHASQPSFSPDGKKLALFLCKSSNTDDMMMKKRLCVLRVETPLLLGEQGAGRNTKRKEVRLPCAHFISPVGGPENKRSWAKAQGPLVWSPDSSRIGYIKAASPSDPKASQLCIATIGATSLHNSEINVTPDNFEGHVENVQFITPSLVLTQASQGCEVKLRTVRLPAQELTPSFKTSGIEVKPPSNVSAVQWTRISLASQFSDSQKLSRAVFLGSSPEHPPEVFTVDLSVNPGVHGTNPGIRSDNPGVRIERCERLTESNVWARNRLTSRQEIIRWKARDGLWIEGVLMWPVGRVSKPSPLIVAVHGGPESHCRNNWLSSYSRPGQIASAKGYFVLYPNYRGSTGRGVKFSQANQGRMALEEFDDILDGVHYLANQGLVDLTRVGITGGSYGGYASAWGATRHSEHYQASVMSVGVSDQVSKHLTTDIPEEIEAVHWLKNPITDLEAFIRSSPIAYLKYANTPLLIMHGKNDTRVPPTQSIELFRGLKMKGDVRARLVLYEKEGHGNRRYANRLDFSLRQMRWFDHYLATPETEEDRRRRPPPVREVEYGDPRTADTKTNSNIKSKL